MSVLKKVISDNLLLVGIIFGILGAFTWSGPGVWLSRFGTTNYLVVLIFIIQGAQIDKKTVPPFWQLIRTFGWGFVVCQVLSPLAGLAVVHLFNWAPDHQVGFILACCMAPSLVTSIVLTGRVNGNEASALLLSAGLNLLGTLVIPINLKLTLGAVVHLDTLALFLKLLAMVGLPVLLGQWFRSRKRHLVDRYQYILRQIPVVNLAIVIYIAFSLQMSHLKQVALGDFMLLVPAAITVNLALMAAGYYGGRHVFRLETGDCKAVALVCSQKTIPLAILVWSNVFAVKYPLAMLAPLVYHFSQTFIDGMLVSFWGKSRH